MEKKENNLKEGKSKEESKKPISKRDKYGGWYSAGKYSQ